MLLDPDRLQMCPALIHGDLVVRALKPYETFKPPSQRFQKGNTGQYKDGQPVIYNPASWYAHNEFE